MQSLALVYLCFLGLNNAHLYDSELKQDIISHLKEFFGEEINSIKKKHESEINSLKNDLSVSWQEIDNLKLKLDHERLEKTQEMNRLRSKYDLVIKDLSPIKNQLKAEHEVPDKSENQMKDFRTGFRGTPKNKDTVFWNFTNLSGQKSYSKVVNRQEDFEENKTNFLATRKERASKWNEKRQLRGQRRQVTIANGPVVAFFASLNNHSLHTNANQDIVFEKAVTNIGNAYHVTHGIFVAPVPGIYVFSVSILAQGQHAHVKFVRNGQLVSRVDLDDWEQSSQTIVLYLKAGEDVAIRNDDIGGINFHGELYSSFSGFLLYDYTDVPVAVGK